MREWLSDFTWEMVIAQNAVLCQAKKRSAPAHFRRLRADQATVGSGTQKGHEARRGGGSLPPLSPHGALLFLQRQHFRLHHPVGRSQARSVPRPSPHHPQSRRPHRRRCRDRRGGARIPEILRRIGPSGLTADLGERFTLRVLNEDPAELPTIGFGALLDAGDLGHVVDSGFPGDCIAEERLDEAAGEPVRVSGEDGRRTPTDPELSAGRAPRG